MSRPRANQPEVARGSLASYGIGFGLSLLCTLEAYFLVQNHRLAHPLTIFLVVGLALAQFVVQIVFFLHLDRESKPRWNLVVFLFMVIVVGILVGGSLWIMTSLNYHMSPTDVNNYLNSQDGL